MATATQEKLVLAESAVTIHVKRVSEPGLLPDGTEGWDIESKILFPGETMPLDDMPPYLSNAVKKGEVPGLKLMTPAQAKKHAAQVKAYYEGIQVPPTSENEAEEDPEFPAEEI
jgi:hypothetical protein